MKHSKNWYFVQTTCGLYVCVSHREFEYLRHDCNMNGFRPDIETRIDVSDECETCRYHFMSFDEIDEI